MHVRENSWIEMALQLMKQMGYLMKNAVTRAFAVDTHWSFKVTSSRLCEACWVLCSILFLIWKCVPLHRRQGWYDRQSKQRSFYIMKMVMRQMVYSNTAIISAFLFSFPYVYISPLYYWTIMRKIPDITLGLNCEIANIWQFIDQ